MPVQGMFLALALGLLPHVLMGALAKWRERRRP